MLKKFIFGFLFIISLSFIGSSLFEEATTIITFQNEKLAFEEQEELGGQVTKLQIPEWNFERFIKVGTVNQIDDSFATYIKGNQNNIVLAGHDIPIVFHDLQKIKIGMKVYLKKGNKIVEYRVADKKSVKPTEVQYLKDTEEEQLTLITCTEDDQKRLIVICKKNDVS